MTGNKRKKSPRASFPSAQKKTRSLHTKYKSKANNISHKSKLNRVNSKSKASNDNSKKTNTNFKSKANNDSLKSKANEISQSQSLEKEEVIIDEEDMLFFGDEERNTDFLMSIDPSATHIGKEFNLEQFEAKKRKANWVKQSEPKLENKLLVKNWKSGKVELNRLLLENEEDEKDETVEIEEESVSNPEALEEDVSDSDALEGDEAEFEAQEEMDEPKVATEESLIDRNKYRKAMKVKIALLCESILEKPEEALKKQKDHACKYSKFEELHMLVVQESDLTIWRLVILSELALFLDLLPEYRIRAPVVKSKTDSAERKLKKTVKELSNYEAALLKRYQIFLKYCSAMLKRKSQKPHSFYAALKMETAIKCLAELLKAKYTFNFHTNLILALVPLADSPLVSIRNTICAAFSSVFISDKSGVISLEIVKQISTFVRRIEYRVKSGDIFSVFLKLPLEISMSAGESARKKAKIERNTRRKLKRSGDTIHSGLKEAEAIVDPNERAKTQVDILNEVILIYFRVLKQATRSIAILSVLEGLAKFAFLINIDIVIDLLKLLKALLRENVLTKSAALHAILTGLKAIQGPGQELLIDEKEFIDILYAQLEAFIDLTLEAEEEQRKCVMTALQCVEVVFLQRKELALDRVAAFIKRLCMLSILYEPPLILAILKIIHRIFHRYKKLHQLLESDVDRIASGEYRADVQDPDLSNPFTNALWELALFQRHFDVSVSSFAVKTSNAVPCLPSDTADLSWKEVGGEHIVRCFETQVRLPQQRKSAKGKRTFVHVSSSESRFFALMQSFDRVRHERFDGGAEKDFALIA